MNAIPPLNCPDCPLLDKTIENGCPAYSQESAIAGRTFMVFLQGEHLFEEGSPIDGIHCLYAGQVALARKSQEGEEEMWLIGVAKPGDVLGMPELLSEETHRNGALAIQDTYACFIPKAKALELFQKNPAIMLRIMRKVCERIQSLEQARLTK